MSERRFPFLNRVTISGTVARKLALRTNKSGVATLKLPLTVSLPTLSDDLSRQRLSTIRVSVFIVGQLAVSCERMLTTGAEIIVEGRLSSPPSHGSVSRLEVHAERIQLVDSAGALQFLERDFLEQNSPPAAIVAKTDTPVAAKESATKQTPAAKEVSVAKRSESKRSESKKPRVAKPSAVKKVAKPESATDESKGESETKPKTFRSRRKRPAPPVTTSTELNALPLMQTAAQAAPVDKPKSRRSQRPKKSSTAREVASESVAAISTGSKPVKARPIKRKPTEKKSTDSKSEDRKSTGSRRAARPSGSATRDRKSATSDQKTKENVVSKDKKKTSVTKPSSNSPFELVESKDSFDPFLLDE